MFCAGLFSASHMEYALRKNTSTDVNNPTLEEMTRTAIRLLQKEEKGFVLLVEGLYLASDKLIRNLGKLIKNFDK